LYYKIKGFTLKYSKSRFNNCCHALRSTCDVFDELTNTLVKFLIIILTEVCNEIII